MKKILIIIQIDTHFVELSRVAKLIKNSSEYTPILWFKSPYATIERDIAICKLENWEYIIPKILDKSQDSSSETKPDNINIFKLLRRFGLKLYYRFGHHFFIFYLINHFFEAHEMKGLLMKRKPHLLIMAEDSIAYGLFTIIKMGNKLRIPTIIVPFTIANASEPAEALYENPAFNMFSLKINTIIGRLFPQWVYKYRGRSLLRTDAWDILALELLGLAPRNPWMYNTEETSILAVESEFMNQYYLKEGLPPERLKTTGALYDDVLAEGLNNLPKYKNILYEDLNLNKDQPLLLVGFPPSQFPRSCEFPDYAFMIQFLMQSLNEIKGWNVIVKPHPRMPEGEIDVLIKCGAKIVQSDTACLVPLCDIYFACVSATIRWAIACGKPVINYDIYNMNYSDYTYVKGVLNVNTKDLFLKTLNNLISDKEYYRKIETAQRESMSIWGNLDGKSGERMLNLIKTTIEN